MDLYKYLSAKDVAAYIHLLTNIYWVPIMCQALF